MGMASHQEYDTEPYLSAYAVKHQHPYRPATPKRQRNFEHLSIPEEYFSGANCKVDMGRTWEH